MGWFDKRPIHMNPLADPRSPESGMTYNGRLQGSLGKQVPIVGSRIILTKFQWQIGVEGATWAVLGYKNTFFPLLSQDYYMSVPLYLSLDKLTGAIKYNHISAHLGDGMTNREPSTYSRDFLSLELAYKLQFDTFYYKFYILGAYNTRIYPAQLKRWAFSTSAEAYMIVLNSMELFYAQDILFNEGNDYSGQFGIIVARTPIFEPRIAFTLYSGKDPRGQFYQDHITRFGIGFFIR